MQTNWLWGFDQFINDITTPKGESMNNLIAEANRAFYEWEQSKFGDNTPLSDYDREIFVEGYINAKKHKEDV